MARLRKLYGKRERERKKEGKVAAEPGEGEEERNGTVQEARTSSACNDLFTGKQFL